MTEHSTRTRRSARWHAQQIAGSQRQADQYRKLLAEAERLGVTDYAERLRADAAEMDNDVDDCIESAMLDGWSYEDIEAAS